MRSRLAYLHLPKAAGTSIRAALSGHFEPDETVPFSFDRYLFGSFDAHQELQYRVFLGDPVELSGYRYMEGHWSLPTVLGAFDAADVACVLREPRSRFLSHYTFWRSWTDDLHELWEPYRVARLAGQALSAYATDPRVAHQSDNLATRLILGPHALVPVDGFISSSDIEVVAAEACERLDGLGFVDVLERGDQVYAAFETWCGEPMSRDRLNETDPSAGDPVDLDDLADPATTALIEDRNAADLIVWRHVARQRGLTDGSAHELADATYDAVVTRITAAAATSYHVAVDVDAPNNPHSIAIRMVGSGRSVLEVGCAGGHVTEHLAANGNDVVGVELDPAAAEQARAHATRVHELDLERTPVSSVETGPFDVILLGDVLEHLRNPVAVLEDLVPLVGREGKLVISVPHVGHIDIRLMLLHGRWEYQRDGLLDTTHLRWFTKSELRSVLARVGFVAVSLERVTVPTGGTILPIGDPPPELVRYIEADPEAHTHRLIVEARREGDDVLAAEPAVEWPPLGRATDDEVAALLEENAALRNEVDAWRRSRVVRMTEPVRALIARLRRSP